MRSRAPDGKVEFAMRATFKFSAQFLVKNHRLAFRALRPSPSGMSRFFGLLAQSLEFFSKVSLRLLAGVGVNAGSTVSIGAFFFRESSRGH